MNGRMDASPPEPPWGEAIDASGAQLRLARAPARIVSLVPSVSETLFALDLGDRLVGVTDWCIHPADRVARLPRVGGTKNPKLEAIERLAPDLVIANLEENRAVDVRRLRERGIAVWVDYPRSVRAAIEQVRWLARLGALAAALARVLEPIEAALAAAQASRPAPPRRGFIAVWKEPWMTLSRDTYAHDLLAIAGIANLFADCETRYPRIALEEIAARDPEVVLLPDEPYRFTADDARELAQGALAGTAAARTGEIHVIDGTLPFWHGPRIARALEVLCAISRGAAP